MISAVNYILESGTTSLDFLEILGETTGETRVVWQFKAGNWLCFSAALEKLQFLCDKLKGRGSLYLTEVYSVSSLELEIFSLIIFLIVFLLLLDFLLIISFDYPLLTYKVEVYELTACLLFELWKTDEPLLVKNSAKYGFKESLWPILGLNSRFSFLRDLFSK